MEAETCSQSTFDLLSRGPVGCRILVLWEVKIENGKVAVCIVEEEVCCDSSSQT